MSEYSFENMQYLHETLIETLSLHTLFPMVSLIVYINGQVDSYFKVVIFVFLLTANGKPCISNDTLPDGLNVNKGDILAYHSYAMGRMKFIWGD